MIGTVEALRFTATAALEPAGTKKFRPALRQFTHGLGKFGFIADPYNIYRHVTALNQANLAQNQSERLDERLVVGIGW
jgi:hypothetical protein